jgi:oligopeptide transport system substrate-binding protein
MKKILALFLALAMMTAGVFAFSGCSQRDEDDRGATLLMYLTSDPSNLNLDPARKMYSAEAIKLVSLMFEGLMVMDEDGKLSNGMAKSWTVTEDEERGVFRMVFEIKETRWSDGKPVTADDFVFAWKRILEPEFVSPAAALLFPIRNARAVKEGYMTVDDLGAFADDMRVLRIEFERKIDYDKFLENLTSPYLVPLRADTIDPQPDAWAKVPLTMLTNGPFSLKQIEYNRITSLDRSMFYLQPEGRRNLDPFRYVTPFRIHLDFARNLERITDAYVNNDYIFFLGDVPKARWSEFESQAVVKDLLSSYAYHFNAEVRPFNDARVRKALSIALDRNEIARLASLGVKPATGIVPHGAIDAQSNRTFREVRGNAIDPGGNIAEARSLLSAAGVSSGSFELRIRRSEVERAVAEYVVGIWGQLGFNVTVREMAGISVQEAILSRDYEVMGYDMVSPGVCAFSVLAQFAKPFSGNLVEFHDEDHVTVNPFVTGFQDDAYDAIIEEIFLLDGPGDYEARNARLFDAEKMLVDLSPVAPLFFNTSINITRDIRGLTYSKYGYTIFTKADLRDYQQWTTEETP